MIEYSKQRFIANWLVVVCFGFFVYFHLCCFIFGFIFYFFEAGPRMSFFLARTSAHCLLLRLRPSGVASFVSFVDGDRLCLLLEGVGRG